MKFVCLVCGKSNMTNPDVNLHKAIKGHGDFKSVF